MLDKHADVQQAVDFVADRLHGSLKIEPVEGAIPNPMPQAEKLFAAYGRKKVELIQKDNFFEEVVIFLPQIFRDIIVSSDYGVGARKPLIN